MVDVQKLVNNTVELIEFLSNADVDELVEFGKLLSSELRKRVTDIGAYSVSVRLGHIVEMLRQAELERDVKRLRLVVTVLSTIYLSTMSNVTDDFTDLDMLRYVTLNALDMIMFLASSHVKKLAREYVDETVVKAYTVLAISHFNVSDQELEKEVMELLSLDDIYITKIRRYAKVLDMLENAKKELEQMIKEEREEENNKT